MAKRSTRPSTTEKASRSQTANGFDSYLLQPNTTSSVLHGLFIEVERKASAKTDDKKVSLGVA